MIDEFNRAVFGSDLRTVQQLVRKGVDVNSTDRDGRTALMYAVLDTPEDAGILEFLIDNSADVTVSERGGWTALHFAARDKKSKFVRQLLEAGVQVDPVDGYGNTPLWRAVFGSSDDLTIIKMLIEHGADPKKCNHSDVSPWILAETMGRLDLVEFFDANVADP